MKLGDQFEVKGNEAHILHTQGKMKWRVKWRVRICIWTGQWLAAQQHQPSGKHKSQYGWETVPFPSLTIMKNSKEGKREGREKKRERKEGRREGGGRKKERNRKKRKKLARMWRNQNPPCIAGCWLDCSAGLGSHGGKPSPYPGASMGLLRPPEAKSFHPAVTMARPFCNE